MARKREELRQRREQLGLTQEAAAIALGVATSSYRGWEAGTRNARVGFRPRIARVFDVPLSEVYRWFGRRAIAPNGMAVPSWLGTYAALEQGAAELWTFEPMVVPGLLQTADYAAAVQRCEIGEPTGHEIDQHVSHRMARQAVLNRSPDPLRLAAVLDESVLHRPAGGATVMAAQLGHLAVQADRPNIDVRVLPLGAGGFPAAFGSFTVLTAPGWRTPYMACVLDRAGPHYLDRAHELDAHIELFRHLQGLALSSADSIQLFRTVAQERYP